MTMISQRPIKYGNHPEAYEMTIDGKTALIVFTSKQAALPEKWLVWCNNEWTRHPHRKAAFDYVIKQLSNNEERV